MHLDRQSHGDSTFVPLIHVFHISECHLRRFHCKSKLGFGMVEFLSQPAKGCSRKLFLLRYRSLIRTRLNYPTPVYNFASKPTLELLDPIQSPFRLFLGAVHTSPAISLGAKAAELPLLYRRLILTINLLSFVF